MKKSWVLVLLADSSYVKWAFETIQMARSIGEWKETIVLLCPEGLEQTSPWKELGDVFKVTWKPIPPRDQTELWKYWQTAERDYDYYYLAMRPNIFYKFYIFTDYFQQWDVVFYLDASCRIQGSLSRFQRVCEPSMCLYAHSNTYPSYEWKLSKEFVNPQTIPFPLERDYFQSTLLIYDTQILHSTIVDRLFELATLYTPKNDQGTMNLYFQFEVPIWKQIPLRDDQGWLYDFHERFNEAQDQYVILKKPIAEMSVRR